MFLTGCSAGPIGRRAEEPPPPNELPTSFDDHPKIQQLWNDIKTSWRSKHADQPLSILEREVDVGFRGFDRDRLTERVNKQGTIELQEVLEYAYRHEEYYEFLHRQGFPVPFAMSDFDPKTTDDLRAHDTLVREVREVQTAYDAEHGAEKVSKPDEYRIGLATAIREKLRRYADAATDDCRPEMVDWKAISKGCGACTEFSSILYFAYREAGLDPRFMMMDRVDSSLRFMLPILPLILATPAHSLIGIPLTNGRSYYADLMPVPNESPDFYRYAIEMSPRHFAVSHLDNLTAAIADPGTRLPLFNKLREIAPENPSNWSNLILAQRDTKQLSPESFEHSVAEMHEHILNKAEASYVLTVVQELYQKGAVTRDTMDRALAELERNDPQAGLLIRLSRAESKLAAVKNPHEEKENIAALLDLVRPVVDRDPSLASGIALIDLIARLSLNRRGIVSLYRELHRAKPDHHTISYLLADACFECWKTEESQPNTTQIESRENVLAEGMQILKDLVRLEPDIYAPHATLSELSLKTGDLALASTEFYKALEILDKGSNRRRLDFDGFAKLIVIACAVGTEDDVRGICNRFPVQYARAAAPSLVEGFVNDDTIFSAGSPVSLAELEKRTRNTLTVITALQILGVAENDLNLIRLHQALNLYSASHGNEKLVGALTTSLRYAAGEPPALMETLRPERTASKALLLSDRKELPNVERSMKYFLEILPEPRQKTLVPMLVAYALLQYRAGHEAKGNQYVRKAFKLDMKEAEWAFRNMSGLFLDPMITRESVNLALARPRDGMNELALRYLAKESMNGRQKAHLAAMFRRIAIGFDAVKDSSDDAKDAKNDALKAAAAI